MKNLSKNNLPFYHDAEGIMKYTTITENHDKIQKEGGFKLYFTLEYEWWSIYYFVLPGFEFSDV